MRSVIVRVEAHLVETGLWCDTCLLPSVVRFVVTLRHNPMRRLGEAMACTDCGITETKASG